MTEIETMQCLEKNCKVVKTIKNDEKTEEEKKTITPITGHRL